MNLRIEVLLNFHQYQQKQLSHIFYLKFILNKYIFFTSNINAYSKKVRWFQ